MDSFVFVIWLQMSLWTALDFVDGKRRVATKDAESLPDMYELRRSLQIINVCVLQCYTAMPTASLVRTQSESPPDIPLPGNSHRRWFARQNTGRDINGANTRNTRTGNIKWSQQIKNLPGSLQNQSSPDRFSSGVFRTFYSSSNNLTTDTNSGISDRSNGFKSGPIDPNIFKAIKRVISPNGAINSVNANTGSGRSIGSILDILMKNNSFGRIQPFHSVMKSSNLTSPDFFHDVGKRLHNSIGHNSKSNAYNSTKHVFSGPITWKSVSAIQMPQTIQSTNLTKNNIFSTHGSDIRFNSTPNAFNTLDRTANSQMHVISAGMPPPTTSSKRFKTSSAGTVSKNFSLNSLLEMDDKSQNRLFVQNRDKSSSSQYVDSADQHSPSQKDIDKVFNSLKLPFFERKHLKMSSTDIQRDLKEVVKLWIKQLETDLSASQSAVVRNTTATDNGRLTDHEEKSNIPMTTIVTDTTDKRLKTSIERNTVPQKLAYVNKSTTSVPSGTESDKPPIQIAQDKETSKTPRKQTTEFREVNQNHAGKTIKRKIYTSKVKTNNKISTPTAPPESTIVPSTSTRSVVTSMRKKPDAKTNDSNHVKPVRELPKLEHFHRPKSTVLLPIFAIPSAIGKEAKSMNNIDFEPRTSAPNIKKLTVRSSTQCSTTSSSLLRRNINPREHTSSTHNTTKVIQDKSITPSSLTTLPPIFNNRTEEPVATVNIDENSQSTRKLVKLLEDTSQGILFQIDKPETISGFTNGNPHTPNAVADNDTNTIYPRPTRSSTPSPKVLERDNVISDHRINKQKMPNGTYNKSSTRRSQTTLPPVFHHKADKPVATINAGKLPPTKRTHVKLNEESSPAILRLIDAPETKFTNDNQHTPKAAPHNDERAILHITKQSLTSSSTLLTGDNNRNEHPSNKQQMPKSTLEKSSIPSSQSTLPPIFVRQADKDSNQSKQKFVIRDEEKSPMKLHSMFVPKTKSKSANGVTSMTGNINDRLNVATISLITKDSVNVATEYPLSIAEHEPLRNNRKRTRHQSIKKQHEDQPRESLNKLTDFASYPTTTLPIIFRHLSSSTARKDGHSQLMNTSLVNRIAENITMGDARNIIDGVNGPKNVGLTFKNRKVATTEAVLDNEDFQSRSNIEVVSTTQKEAMLLTDKSTQEGPRGIDTTLSVPRLFEKDTKKAYPAQSKNNTQFVSASVASKLHAILKLLYPGVSRTNTNLGQVSKRKTQMLNGVRNVHTNKTMGNIPTSAVQTTNNKAPGNETGKFSNNKNTRHIWNNEAVPTFTSATEASVIMDESALEKVVNKAVKDTGFAIDLKNTISNTGTTETDVGITEPSVFKLANDLRGNKDTQLIGKSDKTNDKLHEVTLPILELLLGNSSILDNFLNDSLNESMEAPHTEPATNNAFKSKPRMKQRNAISRDERREVSKVEKIANGGSNLPATGTDKDGSINIRSGINILNAMYLNSPKHEMTLKNMIQPKFITN